MARAGGLLLGGCRPERSVYDVVGRGILAKQRCGERVRLEDMDCVGVLQRGPRLFGDAGDGDENADRGLLLRVFWTDHARVRTGYALELLGRLKFNLPDGDFSSWFRAAPTLATIPQVASGDLLCVSAAPGSAVFS